MAFSYRQFAPRAGLAHWVDAYWVNQCGPGDADATPLRILPDGCIDLVLRADAGDRDLFASALASEPHEVVAQPGTWFVGARFRPGMARAVLDVPASACRDVDLAAQDIDTSFAEFARCVSELTDPLQALAALQAEVEARVERGARRCAPPSVLHAVSLLESAAPPMTRELARRVGLSERSLHREMVAWTGFGPKLLARILRMQRATGLLQSGGRSLADVALRAGYSDQPHMTRELRRLTGRAPAEHATRTGRNVQAGARRSAHAGPLLAKLELAPGER